MTNIELIEPRLLKSEVRVLCVYGVCIYECKWGIYEYKWASNLKFWSLAHIIFRSIFYFLESRLIRLRELHNDDPEKKNS